MSCGLYHLLLLSFPILFLVFMLIGLHFFFAEKSPDQKNTSRRSVSHSWATVKRLVFGAVGDLLIVIGISTIVRSVIQLIQRAVQNSFLILASGTLRRRWGDVSVVGISSSLTAAHSQAP